MTTTEICIAMAELDGWRFIERPLSTSYLRGVPPHLVKEQEAHISMLGSTTASVLFEEIPDFPNDLNAVRRVEAKFVSDFSWCIGYQRYLLYECGHDENSTNESFTWHADAITRCRAILKVEGKWKD